MTDLTKVLVHGWPGAEWSLDGDELAGLDWKGPGPKPTQAEVNAVVVPPPIDPHAELVAAIANAIKDEPPGSPVRKLGEALLGQTSAGRVAGRPV